MDNIRFNFLGSKHTNSGVSKKLCNLSLKGGDHGKVVHRDTTLTLEMKWYLVIWNIWHWNLEWNQFMLI
ncbi:hypothetical protein XELAEV_18042179mg [Xenopus laevis]|uniref:Uncharacterized protein n=1 Tax=Xenopus laevis TaxID=8355 RepID=A0A974H696_XENLA|nr:hypothetical protein XELAEV_18042179mg [Xenopus laevis]